MKSRYLVFIFIIMQSLFAQDYYSESQKKIMARRAAIVDAYRLLAESVKGVRITSQTTVNDFVTESDKITANMKGFIVRGAQITSTRYMPDGVCEVDMALNINDLVYFLQISQRQHQLPGWNNVNFRDVQNFHNSSVIKVTGSGAPPTGMSSTETDKIVAANRKMSKQIAHLNETIEQLNQKLARAESNRRAYFQVIEQNKLLKKQLKKSRGSQKQVLSLVKQNSKLQKEIAQWKKNNQSMQEKLQKMSRFFQESVVYRQKFEDCREKCKKWQNEAAKLQQQVNIYQGKQQEYQATSEEAQRLKQVIQKNQETIIVLEGYKEQYKEARQQLEKAKQVVKKQQGVMVILQNYKQQYQQTVAACKKLQKEKNLLGKKLKNMQGMFNHYSAYKTKYEEMVTKHRQAEKSIKSFQAQVKEMYAMRQKISGLLENIAMLRKQNESIKVELVTSGKWQNDFNQEKNKNRQLTAENMRLLSQVKSLKTSNGELVDQVAGLKSQIHSMQNRISGAWVSISPKQKLMARRVAILDGYRLLLESLKGVRINSSTTVQDFVAVSDKIDAAMKGFIRGAQITATRYLPDGTCEVDMQVDVDNFVQFLKMTARETGSGNWKKKFNNIKRNEQREYIKATGTGTFK